MPRALSDLQTRIMEQLIAGPKTIRELVEVIGAQDNSVRGALEALKESRGCVHVKDYVQGAYRVRCARYAAGQGRDAPYPYSSRDLSSVVAKRVKDELQAQAVELKKKKAQAEQSTQALLKKQNTPFGWLLENANGNDARG